MGGIVGVFNVDGAPLEGARIDALTASLSFRGPDRRRWRLIRENVGFGHASLASTDVCGDVEQPFTLDGRHWIVADARIDARRDLFGAIVARAGGGLPGDMSDVELILRAYLRWEEGCVEHLLGDFTFAVWDEPRQRLFCARDQLGVKPFYYAECGGAIVFSNTLDTIRCHGAVSCDLNDTAIADFLLFGANHNPETTTFRDICRLPPAHSRAWSNGAVRCRRYWTPPIDEPIRFARAADYADRFRDLLQAAVRDRLRTDRAGVLMSGGLDSSTLAATALGVLRDDARCFVLQAFTSVYDRLIPDDERHYAGLVARHLNIPIRFDVRDDETSLMDWARLSVHTPEPVENPASVAASEEFLRKAAVETRVFLYGEGPDNALHYEWRPYLSYLLRQRRFGLLVRDLLHDLALHRRVPFWSSIKHFASARRERDQWRLEYPEWIDDDFAAQNACRDRWDAGQQPASSPHPIRPAAFSGFANVLWQSWFEDCDYAAARARVEFRHPFLDLRLLRYMLALPAMPWCRNKLILRRSMQSALPKPVLRRTKTPLAGHPDWQRVQAAGFPRWVPSPALLRYVRPDKVPSTPKHINQLRDALRPLGLNYWLNELRSTGRKDASR